MPNNIYTWDKELELATGALIAASAAALVGGSAKILDMGPGFFRGDLVIDTTAIENASNDELFQIEWQLSSSATFASDIVVASVLRLGALEVTFSSADSATGRWVHPVTNSPNGTIYRYGRVFCRISGTIATGINYSAFMGVPIV